MKCAWAHSLPHEVCQEIMLAREVMRPMQPDSCHLKQSYITSPTPLTALGAGAIHTADFSRSFDSWKSIDQAL
jgi:hypothetical protein